MQKFQLCSCPVTLRSQDHSYANTQFHNCLNFVIFSLKQTVQTGRSFCLRLYSVFIAQYRPTAAIHNINNSTFSTPSHPPVFVCLGRRINHLTGVCAGCYCIFCPTSPCTGMVLSCVERNKSFLFLQQFAF